MIKFSSDHSTLQISSVSQRILTFLNPQLITLVDMTDRSIEALNALNRSPIDALECLKRFGITSHRKRLSTGPSMTIASDVLQAGFSPSSNEFLFSLLSSFRMKFLLDIRFRTRLPVQESVTCLGVIDELQRLEKHQIFLKFVGADPSYLTESRCLVKKRVLVGRNPSLHPGDLRICEAVECSGLDHLENVVVFPSVGDRPLTNMMSGGDLDGDIYFVIWDPNLIPVAEDPPAEYSSAAPAPSSTWDLFGLAKRFAVSPGSDVFDIGNVVKFFVDYIRNDNLGIICNAHLATADASSLKARDYQCLQLAQLASIAVDFFKTGIAAEIPSSLRPKKHPDLTVGNNILR